MNKYDYLNIIYKIDKKLSNKYDIVCKTELYKHKYEFLINLYLERFDFIYVNEIYNDLEEINFHTINYILHEHIEKIKG